MCACILGSPANCILPSDCYDYDSMLEVIIIAINIKTDCNKVRIFKKLLFCVCFISKSYGECL